MGAQVIIENAVPVSSSDRRRKPLILPLDMRNAGLSDSRTPDRLALRRYEKNIIRHTAVLGFAIFWVGIHHCAITELIPELISSPGFLVSQCEREDAQFGKSVQFTGLRNAVVVFVNPKQEMGEYGIAAVDDPVAVSSIFWLVEFGQGRKTIRVRGFRLLREIAEEFLPAVDLAVVIAVQSQKGVAGGRCCPCQADWATIAADVENNAVVG